MTLTFASDEWIEALWAGLRADETARTEGATWTYGPVALVIEAEPDKSFAEDVAVRVEVHEGEVREVRRIDAGPRVACMAPFVIAAPYSRWKHAVGAAGNPVEAILDGAMRFRGDLPAVHRHAGLFTALLAAAGRLDTSYPDDVAAADAAEPARA